MKTGSPRRFWVGAAVPRSYGTCKSLSLIGTKSGSSLLPESLRDAQSTRNNVNHMRNQADPPAASAGHRVSLNRDALMYIVVANVLGSAAQSGRLGRGLTQV